MTQRLAPAPVGTQNVPREFDADLLRPEVATVDDLLDLPSDVTSRPQGRQGSYDGDGWYTPPPTTAPTPAVAEVPPGVRPAAWMGTLVSGGVLVAALAGGLAPAQPPAPALAPGHVAALVADGFARLGTDDGAAAAEFRRALASEPDHAAALAGLGEATLASDPAVAVPSLCAAAQHPGAARAYALGLLDQHDIRCD